KHRSEVSVIGRRRAATLHVAEDGRPHLTGDAGGELTFEYLADATQPDRVGTIVNPLLHRERTVSRPRALRYDDDGEVLPAALSLAAHAYGRVDVVLDCRDLYDVGPAGHAADKRHSSGISAHRHDHHHPIVALRGRMQAIDGLRNYADRRIEAERALRR